MSRNPLHYTGTVRAEGSSLCISITLITHACSKNSGPIVLRASNLHHLRFIPLKSRAVNLPACFNRWVRRQVLAGDWSWLCPCSVHLQRPSLIDSWAAIHWTHTICCQPFADPTHSREQKSSTCLNKLLVFVCVYETETGTKKKRTSQQHVFICCLERVQGE